MRATPVEGTYVNHILPIQHVPGAIATDTDSAVMLQGADSQYGEVPNQRFYSLTRGWDDFERVTLNGWGAAPSGDTWTAEVSTDPTFYEVLGSAAVINPGGHSGTFEQGLPNTKLLFGDMQVRGSWNVDPTTGDMVALGLIAQRADADNMNLVELIEYADQHTMELVILEVRSRSETT